MKFSSAAILCGLLAAAMVPNTVTAATVLTRGVVESITVGDGADNGADISVTLVGDNRRFQAHGSRNLNDYDVGKAMLDLLLRSKSGVPVDLSCNQSCSGNTFDIVTLK